MAVEGRTGRCCCCRADGSLGLWAVLGLAPEGGDGEGEARTRTCVGLTTSCCWLGVAEDRRGGEVGAEEEEGAPTRSSAAASSAAELSSS